MHFLPSIPNSTNTGIVNTTINIASTPVRISNVNFILPLPLANLFDGPITTSGIPCSDPFVQFMSNGFGFFLNTLMQIGGIVGLICLVLGGLLRIAALATQKKEDKNERMFLSKFAFLCAIIFLIPTLIFFLLLVLLPHWYGLGNNTCH